MDKAERMDRARHANRSLVGWRPPRKKKNRHGIGGNNPPRYDPDMPVTGFPMVMRPIEAVSFDGKTELTCRSQVRNYEKKHGVERIGLEYTCGDGHDEKPWWWEEYKENRREREKCKKLDKQGPERFVPSKAPHAPKYVKNHDIDATGMPII